MAQRVFGSTPEIMVKKFNQAHAAQMFTGMHSFNINVANVIAAIYSATGQDIACVHESSLGQFHLEMRGEDLYASMHLPNLIVGTVGGGVGLNVQKEMLELMGCFGKGGANRLAEIIASYCLALDLSTATSLLSDEFVSAHERLGRNHTKSWLKKIDLNKDFFSHLLQDSCARKGQVTKISKREVISGESLIMSLSTMATSRLCGLWAYNVQYEKSPLRKLSFLN